MLYLGLLQYSLKNRRSQTFPGVPSENSPNENPKLQRYSDCAPGSVDEVLSFNVKGQEKTVVIGFLGAEADPFRKVFEQEGFRR